MAVTMKGNLQLMKEINTATILNLLHRKQRLSRAEISKITRLSATTVSGLVEELIADNMVEEAGEQSMVGAGRRAMTLQIKPNGGYVLGVSVGNTWLVCAVFNLIGEKISEYKTEVLTGNEAIIGQIDASIQVCMAKVPGLKLELIKGIGIAVPGIINESGEVITLSNFLKIKDLNVKSELSSRYPDIPFQVTNDSNAAAFAEMHGGVGENRNHLLYLTINEGIGSGLVLNKEIFSGYMGAVGEIAHIPINSSGGSIETVITTPFIMARCKQEAKALGVKIPDSMEEILRRYEAGEEWLQPIFKQILYVTTLLVATAVNFISPEVVVIEGWMIDSELFFDKLRDNLVQFPFPLPFEPDRLIASSYREEGSLHGSATLMLQKLFKAPSVLQ